MKHNGEAPGDHMEEVIERRLAGEKLREIGDSFGVSRERIRQLLERAASKDRELAVKLETCWRKPKEPKPINAKKVAFQWMRENGLQWCWRCKTAKPLDQFMPCSRGKNGMCRECNTKRVGEYVSRNRDKINRYEAERRRLYPEKHAEYCRRWLERVMADPERAEQLREKRQERYRRAMTNPETRDKLRATWRRNNARRTRTENAA